MVFLLVTFFSMEFLRVFVMSFTLNCIWHYLHLYCEWMHFEFEWSLKLEHFELLLTWLPLEDFRLLSGTHILLTRHFLLFLFFSSWRIVCNWTWSRCGYIRGFLIKSDGKQFISSRILQRVHICDSRFSELAIITYISQLAFWIPLLLECVSHLDYMLLEFCLATLFPTSPRIQIFSVFLDIFSFM